MWALFFEKVTFYIVVALFVLSVGTCKKADVLIVSLLKQCMTCAS